MITVCICAIHTNTAAAAAKSLQSCPTLCNPIDNSPTGSPVPEILQGRTLEWVAISFSRVKILKNMISRNFINMLLNKIRNNSAFKQKATVGYFKTR